MKFWNKREKSTPTSQSSEHGGSVVTGGQLAYPSRFNLSKKWFFLGIGLLMIIVASAVYFYSQRTVDPYAGLVVGERFIAPEESEELYSIEGTVTSQDQNMITLKYIDDQSKQETTGQFKVTDGTLYFSTPDYLDAGKKLLSVNETITISYYKDSKEIKTLWYEYGAVAR